MEAAARAVASAGKSSRRRAEAALELIERDPDAAYDAAVAALEETRAEAAYADTLADRLHPLLRRATTVLDSAQALSRQQWQDEERACADTLATEWFVTVHTAAEPARAQTLTEAVVRDVYRGRARQEVDHVHEIVTLHYPVTRTAVVAWTRQRYGTADVSAQPVRNMTAAVQYIRRQSTAMERTEYNRGVFAAGRSTPEQGERTTAVPLRGRLAVEASNVRTHPHIDTAQAVPESMQATKTYTYAGRRSRDALGYQANFSPYALVGRGERMPAGGYTLERVMETLPRGSPLFFSGKGEDVAAVETERDIALAAAAGLVPDVATLFLEREGSYVGDGVRPSESTQQTHRTLESMAAVAGSLLRGTEPPSIAIGDAKGTTADEVQAGLSAAYMAREAALRLRRKERETRVQVNTKNAPLYLSARPGPHSIVASATRRTAHDAGTYANDFILLFDTDGRLAEEAVTTFSHAGVYRMTGSAALLYEGQPALVFDSVQAVRHARNSRRLGARIRIFSGSREEHERALNEYVALKETPVSISQYPV